MLYLTEADVRRLLPMREAIQLLRSAFVRLARGDALNQPRRRLVLPTGSILHYMAGSDGPYFGAKVYSTHPRHGAHFIVLLYRAEDAALLAVLQANYLGQIRTGAATGLATDLMARTDATTVALIGTGFQAATQIEAVAAVRSLREVRVWSRSEERRSAFAAAQGAALRLPVAPTATAERAIRGADIVITATSARDPVLENDWISAGTHINAVGSNQARRRELPADLVRRADAIVVDSLEQARMESGDLLLALAEDDWSRVGELAAVAAGELTPRSRGDEITLFKSNGLAVEDVASAGYVYERALEVGAGRGIAPAYS